MVWFQHSPAICVIANRCERPHCRRQLFSFPGCPFETQWRAPRGRKQNCSDGDRPAAGAERSKDRDRLGVEWCRPVGAWRGPCQCSDQSRPVTVCRSGGEVRLIVFREAETGSRTVGRRGTNPAKRDCAAGVGDACGNVLITLQSMQPTTTGRQCGSDAGQRTGNSDSWRVGVGCPYCPKRQRAGICEVSTSSSLRRAM